MGLASIYSQSDVAAKMKSHLDEAAEALESPRVLGKVTAQ